MDVTGQRCSKSRKCHFCSVKPDRKIQWQHKPEEQSPAQLSTAQTLPRPAALLLSGGDIHTLPGSSKAVHGATSVIAAANQRSHSQASGTGAPQGPLPSSAWGSSSDPESCGQDSLPPLHLQFYLKLCLWRSFEEG